MKEKPEHSIPFFSYGMTSFSIIFFCRAVITDDIHHRFVCSNIFLLQKTGTYRSCLKSTMHRTFPVSKGKP